MELLKHHFEEPRSFQKFGYIELLPVSEITLDWSLINSQY